LCITAIDITEIIAIAVATTAVAVLTRADRNLIADRKSLANILPGSRIVA